MNDDNKFDPYAVIQAADEKSKAGDINGAQMLFHSALLDWVDSAREGAVADPEQVREAIATLWIAYAHFNQSQNMFKSAAEVYEQAVTCPIAGSVGRVWLDYARFCQDREKLRTAQKIYLRALVGGNGQGAAVTDDQDASLLWNEFLEMMKQTKPELTLKELKKAVQEEHVLQGAATLTERVSPVPMRASAAEEDATDERPEKRPRLEEPKTHTVSDKGVADEASSLLDTVQALPPEISAAWFVRDGDSPPTPPHPPLFSASPPKLADPTGSEILGKKLALAVIQRLLKPEEGTILLEACRGLWMLTALKEKEASKTIERLDKTMSDEMEELDKRLETRLSVAGAASVAVQQMNDNERSAFQQSCFQRRQEALNAIAWDFRNLLCTLQQILTRLQVPGFDGPTVDGPTLELQTRLCSYLHSAFYLRTRIGEEAHENMLKSQAERLQKDLKSAPASTTVPPPPPPPAMYNPAAGFPQQQQYAAPGMYVQQQQQPYPGQPMQMMPPGAQQPQYSQQQPPQYYQ